MNVLRLLSLFVFIESENKLILANLDKVNKERFQFFKLRFKFVPFKKKEGKMVETKTKTGFVKGGRSTS